MTYNLGSPKTNDAPSDKKSLGLLIYVRKQKYLMHIIFATWENVLAHPNILIILSHNLSIIIRGRVGMI